MVDDLAVILMTYLESVKEEVDLPMDAYFLVSGLSTRTRTLARNLT